MENVLAVVSRHYEGLIRREEWGGREKERQTKTERGDRDKVIDKGNSDPLLFWTGE